MNPATKITAKAFLLASTLFITSCDNGGGGNGKSPSSDTSNDQVADYRAHGRWRSSSFGGGGYTQNVVFCPGMPERLYAHVDVGGVYRSDDGGNSWRMLHGGLPVGDGYMCVRGLAVYPSNPDRVVIGVGNQWTRNRGIFLTTDGGTTWRKVLDAPFLGNEQHRSTGFVFAITPSGEWLAGTAGAGLWKSVDAGETWALEGLDGVNITDIKIDRNGGVIVCAKPHSMPGGKVLTGGFFTRLPDGEWSTLPEGPDEIVIAPDGALTGLFDSWDVRTSRDGGKTWESDSEGLPIDREAAKGFTSESRFRAIASGPGFQLVGSSRGTIYRRADGERLWTKVERDSVQETFEGKPWWGKIKPGKWQHYGAAMGTLAVNPQNPDNWWLTDWYGIYESTDAGRNWVLKIDGIEVTVIHCLTQDPSDPGRVHAGMADNGYIPSVDGGMRFEGGRKFLSNMKALAIDKSLPGRVYGAGDGGAGEWRAGHLWVSADSGENWVRSPMRGVPVQKERALNSISIRPGHPYEIAVAVSGPVGQGGGVFRSVDGGLSFEPLCEGLGDGAEYFHNAIWDLVSEIAHAPDGSLVVTSHRTGVIHRLPPGETSWQKVEHSLPGKSHQLRANESHLFLTRASGGLWRSANGSDWEQVYNKPCEVLAVDLGVPGRVAVATTGKVEVSEDSGATWQDLGTPPFGQISALGFAGDRLLVGTRGGGFFQTPLSSNANEALVANPPSSGLLPVREEAETPLPTGANRWTSPWRQKGTLEALPHAEGVGVVLRSVDGNAAGSTGWVFNATGADFELRGKWSATGSEGTVAKLALRSLGPGRSQIDWKPLGEIQAGGSAQDFKFQCQLHPDAVQGEIVLLLEGDGSADLRDITFARANAIFGTPLRGNGSQSDH